MRSWSPATCALRCAVTSCARSESRCGDGLVVLRLRHQLLLDQRGQARGVGLGLAQLRLHAADLAARGAELRGGEVALRVGVDRIQRGHHLAGLDVLAFLDQHLAHLAGDLGRHRRHAARDDITGGVEHRGAAAAVADRDHVGGLHFDRLVAAEQRPAEQRQQRAPRRRSPARSTARAAMARGGALRSMRSSLSRSAEAFIAFGMGRGGEV